MVPMNYIPVCGDVVFVGYPPGAGVIADSIRKFTTGWGEEVTAAIHQVQVIEHKQVAEALIGQGVVIKAFQQWQDETENGNAHYIIFRPPTEPIQRFKIDARARKIEGHRYGYVEGAVLQAADGLLRKLCLLKEGFPLFTRLGALIPWTVICSGAGNQCLYAGKVLPKKFVYLSPDGTYDEAIRREWLNVAMDEEGASYWTEAPKLQGEEE